MDTNLKFQMNAAMFQMLVDLEVANGFTHDEAVERVHAAMKRQGWSVKSKAALA